MSTDARVCFSQQDQWRSAPDRCPEETSRGRCRTDTGTAGEYADQWQSGEANGDAEVASCQRCELIIIHHHEQHLISMIVLSFRCYYY